MCIKIQFIFNNLNQSPIKKRNFFYYINLSRCKIVKKITYSYVHIKMKHFLSPSKPVEPLIKSLNPHSPVLNVKNILHSLFHRQKRKKKAMKIFHLIVRSDYSSRVDGSPACFTNLHLSLSSKRGNVIPERADLLNLVLQLRILDSGGSVRSRRFCLVSLLSGFPVSCNVDDPTSS